MYNKAKPSNALTEYIIHLTSESISAGRSEEIGFPYSSFKKWLARRSILVFTDIDNSINSALGREPQLQLRDTFQLRSSAVPL
jgi:hypothetical protein